MAEYDSYKYSPDYHRFASFLGVDRLKRDNKKLADKMAVIYDWAKDKLGRDDPSAIINKVREYQNGLGVTFSGETLVNYLYRNARLDIDRSKKARIAEIKDKSAAKKQKVAEDKLELAKKDLERVRESEKRLKKVTEDRMKEKASRPNKQVQVVDRVVENKEAPVELNI